MQCQAGERGCQGWRSEERMGEGWALSGLEAEDWGVGRGKAVRGGRGISEARGWPGGSGQCQRSHGKEPVPAWGWEGGLRGGRSPPLFFPQPHSALQQKQMLLLLSCKAQEFRVQRALSGPLPNPLFSTDGDSDVHVGDCPFQGQSGRTWTKPPWVCRPVPHPAV